ncbi:MAG: RIP metalloprotease RseP [Vogesella sp.]|uniref:RIP metalloprotease RseP n=1 Tax=Vogesella sp. TaxID=1904252 RepID=UPI0039193145
MTLLSFLLVIGVLVTFHEFGHFLAARLCGVKVLTFSIGFGKPLWARTFGDTEWRLAWIPLGGFVRMLDEREAPVAPQDRQRAFNQRPVWQRMIIVLAGPVANLLLAVVLFSVTMSGEQTRLQPLVGTVAAQTAAAAAGVKPGDRVMAVNGEAVQDWGALREAMGMAIANDSRLELALQRDSQLLTARFDLPAFGLQQLDQNTLAKLGLMPARYLPQIAAVVPEGAAARAGLKAGDKLLTANGQPLASWEAWVQWVHNHPGQQFSVTVLRDGKPLQLQVRPDVVEQDGGSVGRIGAAPALDKTWMDSLTLSVQVAPGEAMLAALGRTVDLSWHTLSTLGAMITGGVSLEALSGPLTIAEYAGKSASVGLVALLEFMALISVSLGVFNLLPVPMLDGGHLLYHVAEWIRGRPLSDRVYEVGQRLGMAFILMVMTLALFNDFARLLAG